MNFFLRLLCVFALLCSTQLTTLEAQTSDTTLTYDYSDPNEFEIGGIRVTGANYSDENALISITGLRVGGKVNIPGTEIPDALKALWRLRLFTDVQIYQEKRIGDVIFLEFVVQERPRLTGHAYRGTKKRYHDDMNDIVNSHLLKGAIVTDNAKSRAVVGIEQMFDEKGYLDAKVTVTERKDSQRVNAVRLIFDGDRGDRVKIQDITFVGNENVKSRKLRKKLKNTKRKGRLFGSSKFIRSEYEGDKKAVVAYYNTLGFRDARVLSDSIWREKDGDLQLQVNIEEGNRYFFRNIAWKGNSIYKSEYLSEVLGIQKGDVYNQELLETRLRFSRDGRDISTLYMDNGYLFFQVDPVESAIIGDSIDLEVRILEGPQATIDRVVINGNDRTHEHVVRRELRTRPGEKFSRSDIIRSQREIINLGYFNPEALGINTPVNPQRGTVDIEYQVEEKPSDQLELSAGWAGAGQGVIGTLGVSFNNFSLRNFFNGEAWSPLPQGDGQRLSLRAQTNGRFFQSYNVSFTEPWLGGKKPTSFTVGGFYNRFAFGTAGTDNRQTFSILGLNTGVGTRLKWPDDNFILNLTLSLQQFKLNNWSRGLFPTDDGTPVMDGDFYNFSLQTSLTRSTVSDPIFPKSGSQFSISLQFTPPYSLFSNRDYTQLDVQERFRFLEYHKWRVNGAWYTALVGNLVLKTEAKLGFLGAFNDEIGIAPFERFQLGGDGFAGGQFNAFNGIDLISLRGYEPDELPANVLNNQLVSTPIFNKFTVELRYPISTNPNSTIYVLAFAQGGNAWSTARDYNPFDLRRSAGMGLRVFLPMFGTLGFDYGLGFDKPNAPTSGSIFSRFGNFNIVLGFEPE